MIQYIRLHKRLDDLLEKYAETEGIRRATACSRILTECTEKMLLETPLESLSAENIRIREIGETYFIPQGRGTSGSNLGRGMRITIEKSTARKIDLIGFQCEIPAGNLRCAMIADYFHRIGIL